MKGIKYALTFVWGFLYSHAIHFVSGGITEANKNLVAFPIFFLIASTVIISVMSVYYLVSHWKEE